MKVDIGNVWNAVDAVQQSSADSVRNPGRERDNRIGEDDAHLSQIAVLAGTLHQSLDGVSETRQARVDELRQKVQQGSYQVSSEQIANALRDDLAGMDRIYKGRR
ncbi:flagellar biosynthesis anti-sigma factor FlgM [Candidatus Korobacter versatilis]|nr:flagellar biosynthesis anti-sigma factor FlgM [Candidatus Koribacter versatilis]